MFTDKSKVVGARDWGEMRGKWTGGRGRGTWVHLDEEAINEVLRVLGSSDASLILTLEAMKSLSSSIK